MTLLGSIVFGILLFFAIIGFYHLIQSIERGRRATEIRKEYAGRWQRFPPSVRNALALKNTEYVEGWINGVYYGENKAKWRKDENLSKK